MVTLVYFTDTVGIFNNKNWKSYIKEEKEKRKSQIIVKKKKDV